MSQRVQSGTKIPLCCRTGACTAHHHASIFLSPHAHAILNGNRTPENGVLPVVKCSCWENVHLYSFVCVCMLVCNRMMSHPMCISASLTVFPQCRRYGPLPNIIGRTSDSLINALISTKVSSWMKRVLKWRHRADCAMIHAVKLCRQAVCL